MDYEVDYWTEEPTEVEGEGTFRPSKRGIIVRLLLLVLLLWVLIQMVLPRRSVNLQSDPQLNPPAEPIEPIYWS